MHRGYQGGRRDSCHGPDNLGQSDDRPARMAASNATWETWDTPQQSRPCSLRPWGCQSTLRVQFTRSPWRLRETERASPSIRFHTLIRLLDVSIRMINLNLRKNWSERRKPCRFYAPDCSISASLATRLRNSSPVLNSAARNARRHSSASVKLFSPDCYGALSGSSPAN